MYRSSVKTSKKGRLHNDNTKSVRYIWLLILITYYLPLIDASAWKVVGAIHEWFSP